MIHILLMILKIIGILLALLFGIVIMLVFIVLLNPLKYKLDVKCEGTFESLIVDLKFTWLYRLVAGFCLFQNEEMDWQIQLGWKKLNTENEEEDFSETKELNLKTSSQTEETEVLTIQEKKKQIEPVKERVQKEPESSAKKQKNKKKKQKKKTAWSDRVKNVWEKIKCTFRDVCDKIKVIKNKKDKIQDFLQNEIHRRAFKKAKKECILYLRKLKPKYVKGRIHFGFEDPATTGKTLAWLSMFYGWYGNHLSIQPDFKEKAFDGELHIKGKTRMITFLVFCLRLIVDKDVRITIQHIRKFKL